MTCIVGLSIDGKVYIGGDSMMSSGHLRHTMDGKKVFRVGAFLIGTAGSMREANLLQYRLSPRAQHAEEDDDMRYMVEVFIEEVRALLKNNGVTQVDNNSESAWGFLVGYRGNLYKVDSDFQIVKATPQIEAIGCGDEFALGVVYALKDMQPEKRILAALEIAGNLSSYIGAPYYVEVL